MEFTVLETILVYVYFIIGLDKRAAASVPYSFWKFVFDSIVSQRIAVDYKAVTVLFALYHNFHLVYFQLSFHQTIKFVKCLLAECFAVA